MKILIIDATNNFIRNYAVVPTSNLNGEPNGGVFGTLKSLNFFARITQPDMVVLVWDGAGGSRKRRTLIKEYKQGRKPIRLNRNFEFEKVNEEQNKIYQRLRVAQFLNDLPVRQITVDDIEADDVIAYLCKLYSDDQKIIASNDKDFYQLLDENTVIYSPRNKLFVNNKYVLESFNIHPKNFALARAMAGDKSDNLSGVRGIGMKNVVKYFPFLLEDRKVEIGELMEHASRSGEKYQKFIDNKEAIVNNLQVMQLRDIIIGNASIEKIEAGLNKPVKLNGTSFRLRLLEDGITSITDSYLQPFKILEAKGKA